MALGSKDKNHHEAISDAPQPRSRRRAAHGVEQGLDSQRRKGLADNTEVRSDSIRIVGGDFDLIAQERIIQANIAARDSRRRRNDELRRQPQITLAGQHLEGSMERTVPR